MKVFRNRSSTAKRWLEIKCRRVQLVLYTKYKFNDTCSRFGKFLRFKFHSVPCNASSRDRRTRPRRWWPVGIMISIRDRIWPRSRPYGVDVNRTSLTFKSNVSFRRNGQNGFRVNRLPTFYRRVIRGRCKKPGVVSESRSGCLNALLNLATKSSLWETQLIIETNSCIFFFFFVSFVIRYNAVGWLRFKF